jgi:AraC-like DNA-binding protein
MAMGADALSDVLRAVRLTGAVFVTVDVVPPWSAPVPSSETMAPIVMPAAQHLISYHLVTAGACWVVPRKGESVRLNTGDVIVFPQGDPHVLCSDPKVPRGAALDVRRIKPAEQWPYRIVSQRSGRERLGLVCGFLACDVRPYNPLLGALPKLMVVNDSTGEKSGWLRQFTQLAVAEATDKRAGGEGVLARLSELMFIEAVRRHLATMPSDQSGWLAGLRDRFIGRALTLLHGKPAHPWTVEELAREVGLSRSSLADRFVHFVGQAPMQYLTAWRMQIAARMLADGADSVAKVAQNVGYDSQAAFNRTFKKVAGAPPATWRRQRG